VGIRLRSQGPLSEVLDHGEDVLTTRALGNAKLHDPQYATSFALMGPAAFNAGVRGSIVRTGEVPDGTNTVAVTDRRLLWCHKGRLSGEPTVLGSDWLAVVIGVEFKPARIALAKLVLAFHDGRQVTFDLPSDHKAAEFVDGLRTLISTTTVGARREPAAA